MFNFNDSVKDKIEEARNNMEKRKLKQFKAVLEEGKALIDNIGEN